MASVAELQAERARDRQVESAAQQERRHRTGGVGPALAALGAAALFATAGLLIERRRAHRPALGQLLGHGAGELGRGFLAGVFGTLAITVASTVDELVTELVGARREKRKPELDVRKAIVSPWSFSAGVVSKVVGISPTSERNEGRLAIMAHWGYGSTWGLSLAAMRAFGVRRLAAMGALLAGQLGAEMIIMPAFDLFPPPTQWGRRAVVSSVYQHAIYALAAVGAFEWLDPTEMR